MLEPGSTLNGRFVIDREIGHGGMGTLYRAVDRLTDELVAVKVLGRTTASDRERFTREARALCGLDHRAIVRYVAEGEDDDGSRYLVMEWLEGEDLGSRLARDRLGIDESVRLVIRVAGALGYAHERGLVHRDVKPSNLFIPQGRIDDVKLLDFGLVRFIGAVERATGTGILVGTPGYLAPEQARSSREIDARADVFALGCVLFECLTGKPAFDGDSVLAILSRIVFGEAPRASSLRVDVPPALDDLVGRMLTKDPDGRPADGHDVVHALENLGAVPDVVLRPSAPDSSSGARRLLCVVLARAAAETLDGDTVQMLLEDALGPFDAVRQVVVSHDARLERLADGSIVAVVTGTGAATDQAVRAGRMALAMRDALKGWCLALATGLGHEIGGPPVGEAVDRALRLLDKPGIVAIDPLTAGLLETRFEVSGNEPHLELGPEHETASRRVLLGKTTPCVGRERERAFLRGLFDQCAAEWITRVALVTAPAGAGKSRLRHEAVHDIGDAAWLISGQGDDLRAGSSFGMLVRGLRTALGLRDTSEAAREELRARVAKHIPPADVQRVSEFLGELVGVRFPDTSSRLLRLARRDADVMGNQMLRAFEELIRSASTARPILIVLDDLQWGDGPSVRFVDAALRLGSRPVLVLAFARPEVSEVFPDLWATHDVQRIELPALSARASERLVHAVLGANLPAEHVRRIVDQANGNAFFLEELIRAEALGQGDSLPETLLATMHARLSALPTDTLETLCRASVFGRTFWASSIDALFPGEPPESRARALDDLLALELVHRRASSSLSGEIELVFRHDLIREAAYSMLPDEDRAAAHRAAAGWLERTGDANPAALARHFERGGLPARAATAYLAAARQSLRGDDLDGAIERVNDGVRCGASGELLGALRLVQGEALSWRGRVPEADRALREAWQLVDEHGPLWPELLVWVARASPRAGRIEQLVEVAEDLQRVAPPQDRRAEVIRASFDVMTGLIQCGRADLVEPIMDRLQGWADAGPPDPAVAREMEYVRAWRALMRGEAAGYIDVADEVIDTQEGRGETRNALRSRENKGFAFTEAGLHEEAVAELRAVHVIAARSGLLHISGGALQNLGLALCRMGEIEEARQVLRQSIEIFLDIQDEGFEGSSWLYLAMTELRADALETAEEYARKAVDRLHGFPPAMAYARAVLARILVRRSRGAEALAFARQAAEVLEGGGDVDEGRPTIHLALVECLEATGDDSGAEVATRIANDWVQARARAIEREEMRDAFLTRVAENAAILEHARKRFGT